MTVQTGVVMGPKWPSTIPTTGTIAHLSLGTLDAADERMIIVGQVQSDDGQSHAYDTIEFRVQTGFTGTLRAGMADIDTTAGPPARDDGTIDQYVDVVNPTNTTTYSEALTASRTLAHGDQIALVFKIEAYTSGGLVMFSLNAPSVQGHRPTMTSFLGGVYALATGSYIGCNLYASGDGHYAIIKGGVPLIVANPATTNINTGTANTRVAMAFQTVAPFRGLEGRIEPFTTANGSFDVKIYEGTTELDSMSIDANTWAADSAMRVVEFTFADVDFVANTTYYLALVPTTATNVGYVTMETTTPERWDPMTGSRSGGLIGTSTWNGSAWSTPDESLMLYNWTFFPIGMDDGAGGGGGITINTQGVIGG